MNHTFAAVVWPQFTHVPNAIVDDEARREAFLRICAQCCEALHVLERLQDGHADDAANIDDAVRERCAALDCPLADFE